MNYDKYLKRLRQQKTDTSTMEMYGKGASALASTGNYLANKMSGLRLGNASASARAATQQQMQEQIGQQQLDLYSNAITTQANQNQQLDKQIMGLQMAQDQYDEQKKAEKQAKKRQLMSTLGQIGGAAAGALLALPTGGMSVMAGAQIGAGLGQAAGSLSPTRGNVPLDLAGAVQGASDAMIGYAGYANQKSMQNKMKLVGSAMPEIAKLSTTQLQTFIPMLRMTLTDGTEAEIDALLKSFMQQNILKQEIPNDTFIDNYNVSPNNGEVS